MKDSIDKLTGLAADVSQILAGLKAEYFRARNIHNQLCIHLISGQGDDCVLITVSQCSSIFGMPVDEILAIVNRRKSELCFRLNDLGELAITLADAYKLFPCIEKPQEGINVLPRALEIVKFLSTFPEIEDERIAFAAGLDMTQLFHVKSVLNAERELVMTAFLGSQKETNGGAVTEAHMSPYPKIGL